ncbi:BTAD domain-containing putative transcriptional regulator [Actinomycetospora cinnamomea]|uniref:BTAD domain-containing putative transcriptional regulator n=1 Tax=Actinomycetospora cinnamomea TaxID=663609 RepID=UPI001401BBF1|nr:BTAD domain-containing putative transcriptional regulator [Actinomycetospora cinnamomea]
MRIRVLGSLELVDDAGAVTALGSPTRRRLLALLVVHRGAVVSADRIAEVLWGRRRPTHPANALQGQVSRLRRALGTDLLETRAPGYLLTLPDTATDAGEFEELVARARDAVARGRPDDATALMDRASGLWRGRAYAEFADEEFAHPEAARLDELRISAEEDRAEIDLALDRPTAVITRAELLVAAHPYRERGHTLLMLGLYRAGRVAEALEAYRRYRARLDDELGLLPSAEVEALHGRMLRQDPDLDRRRPPAPADEPSEHPSEQAPEPAGGRRPSLPALIGRGDDLPELTGTLRRARLVTLVGAGGVGKTLLARHAAAQCAGNHHDGSALVELAAVRDPAAVIDTVSTALGVVQRAGLAPAERLVEFLRPKTLLLVLDNCEHVIEEAAALVVDVVGGCPGVTVLATSREPLGVIGEHVYSLPPLAVPSAALTDPGEAAAVPAVRLLLDRAAEAAPGFAFGPAHVASIAEICRRLDGLPLAIELAAPRLRAMSPAEVAARLDARFPLLRGVRRGVAERQRTLRAVVDWSHELLDEAQQRVFARLAVFAGAFTLVAAEEVCADLVADRSEVAGIVLGLVDRSLVVAQAPGDDGDGRYALLETMRAYGRDRLAEREETDRASRAHAAWAVALAETAEPGLQGPEEAHWVATVAAATDDLRVAHRWSLDHDLDLAVRLVASLFWYAEFRSAEMLDWAGRTVEAAQDAASAHPRLPVVYAMAAVAHRFRGDLARTATLAATGVRLADGPRAGCPPRNILADVAFFEGRLDEAEVQFADLARDTEAAGDRYAFAVALWMRALTRAYGGDRPGALAFARRARAEAHALGNPSMTAWASYAEAEALLDTDPDRALDRLESAATVAATVGNRYLDGVARISAASVRARHGDPVLALRQFREVLVLWHDAGGWTQLWTAMRSVVDLLTRVGADHDAAVLHGAVTASRTASPVFGADRERLQADLDVLGGRLGAEQLAAARRRGAELDDDTAVTTAVAAIDDATAGGPTVDEDRSPGLVAGRREGAGTARPR